LDAYVTRRDDYAQYSVSQAISYRRDALLSNLTSPASVLAALPRPPVRITRVDPGRFELAARCHAELSEHFVQVVGNGAFTDEQLRSYLAVDSPGCR
jgi:hypothetical protein